MVETAREPVTPVRRLCASGLACLHPSACHSEEAASPPVEWSRERSFHPCHSGRVEGVEVRMHGRAHGFDAAWLATDQPTR